MEHTEQTLEIKQVYFFCRMPLARVAPECPETIPEEPEGRICDEIISMETQCLCFLNLFVFSIVLFLIFFFF